MLLNKEINNMLFSLSVKIRFSSPSKEAPYRYLDGFRPFLRSSLLKDALDATASFFIKHF